MNSWACLTPLSHPRLSLTSYVSCGQCLLTSLQHGRLGTSDTERDTSLYYNYASSSHYIIVYPQGVAGDKGTAWQGPSYAYPDVNDIQFVSDLLTYLQDNFCVDINRIYASGKSNGGGFLDLLACSNVGDKFAAFAMAAPALYTDTSLGSCGKKRAILSSHGDADTTIPYAGGEGLGGPLPNVGKWVSWWGQRNCVGGVKTTVTKKNGYETQSLSCKGGLSDVVSHYHLSTPAAHCWPNSKGNNYDAKKYPQGCGDSRVVDFTPVVLKWFAKWTLKNSPK